MAAAAVSYNRIFSKIQNSLPSCIENNNLNLLKELFDFKISEGVKCFVESGIRDYVLRNMCLGEQTNLDHIKSIVNMCIKGVRQDLCLPSLPVLILSDTFDCLTIKGSEELFEFVESNVSVWKEELFFSPCKNQVLRMCNDVLRRLSRSQNTIFCGRILLFLARFFPFSERSGLNLISEFNLENVTLFTDTESAAINAKDDSGSRVGLHVLEEDKKIEDEVEDGEKKPSLDYTLYTKFWALQDFFRNPIQCFQKAPWKLFCKYADDVLEAFSSFKLDSVQSQVLPTCEQPQEPMQVEQYFPKYLTNHKLLDLQFSDSNFRRYILLQLLILGQYLTSNVKFKQETLNGDQSAWVKKMQDKCRSVLIETPPNGREFVDIVKHILKREEIWSEWKNNGCPEMKKPGSSVKMKESPLAAETENDAEPPKKKRKLSIGDIIRDADLKNKYTMGNAEMTRLWNVWPNNLEACQQKSRDFVPSLESYFQSAIEQCLDKTPVKDEDRLVSDSNFGWRGLRLLASKSPHFFTHSANPIATLPEYLNTMVKKLAKDLPSQQVEEVEEEKEEEKVMAMLEQTEAVKEDEEEETEEEEAQREEVKALDEEEIRKLAQAFAKAGQGKWKTLGKKLGYEADELAYFETAHPDLKDALEIMFEQWVVNEKDEANLANLTYILEGLKMAEVIQNIF